MKAYDAPPTTADQQVQILTSRGMIVEDTDTAINFMNKVSYYRFAGYALHFEEFENRTRTHKYKEGTTFESVVSLYDFDSKLRKLLFTAIENIEIAFRTQLCLQVSLDTGDSHWPFNSLLFDTNFEHKKFVDECKKETKRSREIFIENYKNKYDTPPLPASWMLIEIVSFGTWSRVYKSLINQTLKKDVAKYFGIPARILQSWIHSITVFRNLCAHHARLWNRSLTIKPKLTRRMEKAYPVQGNQRQRIVLVLDIIGELLKPLNQYDSFIQELNTLLEKHPTVPIESMGLKNRKIDLETGVRQ